MKEKGKIVCTVCGCEGRFRFRKSRRGDKNVEKKDDK